MCTVTSPDPTFITLRFVHILSAVCEAHALRFGYPISPTAPLIPSSRSVYEYHEQPKPVRQQAQFAHQMEWLIDGVFPDVDLSGMGK